MMFEDADYLKCIDNVVSNLVEEAPYMAYLKDYQTNKFIYGNSVWTATLGCTLNDLCKINAYDLNDLNSVYKKYEKLNLNSEFVSWKDSILGRVKNTEDQAISKRRKTSIRGFIFTSDGYIKIHHLIKAPLFSLNENKCIAILSYSQEITSRYSLCALFSLYKKYYTKKQAAPQMLKHLKLDVYFKSDDFPTPQEMETLLAMRDDPRHKRIAQTLNCSVTTVSNHINVIREKLSGSNKNLEDILIQLRAIPANQHAFL